MENTRDPSKEIQIRPLEKTGDALLGALDAGHMAAIVSEKDLMYVFFQDGNYLCYLHTMDDEEGRARAFPGDSAHRAMIRNLAELADALFEAQFQPGMERMGILFTAEQGIIQYLDAAGKLPIDDVDFMAAYEHQDESDESANSDESQEGSDSDT